MERDLPAKASFLREVWGLVEAVGTDAATRASANLSSLAAENLMFTWKIDPESLVDQVTFLLTRFGPDAHTESRLDRELSPGMRTLVRSALVAEIAHEAPDDLVICWDEPEIGLPPESQSRLAELIQRVGNETVASIVATHSPIVSAALSNGGGSCIRAEIRGHSTEFRRATPSELQPQRVPSWLNAVLDDPASADEVFVLVEGASDVLYLQTALGTGWPEWSLRVVPCGGTFELVPAALALSRLVRSRVIVVVDSDGPGREARDALKRFRFVPSNVLSLRSFATFAAEAEDVQAEDLLHPSFLSETAQDGALVRGTYQRDDGSTKYLWWANGKVELAQRAVAAGPDALGDWNAVAARVVERLQVPRASDPLAN